jgi:hypothetical protein
VLHWPRYHPQVPVPLGGATKGRERHLSEYIAHGRRCPDCILTEKDGCSLMETNNGCTGERPPITHPRRYKPAGIWAECAHPSPPPSSSAPTPHSLISRRQSPSTPRKQDMYIESGHGTAGLKARSARGCRILRGDLYSTAASGTLRCLRPSQIRLVTHMYDGIALRAEDASACKQRSSNFAQKDDQGIYGISRAQASVGPAHCQISSHAENQRLSKSLDLERRASSADFLSGITLRHCHFSRHS